MMHWMVLLLPLLILAQPAAAADMSAAEIRDELVDQPISWYENGGWHAGNLLLSADGSAEITVDMPAPSADLGRWSLQGDRICTVWPSVRQGGAKCYTIERLSSGRYATSGGNTFEIRSAGV